MLHFHAFLLHMLPGTRKSMLSMPCSDQSCTLLMLFYRPRVILTSLHPAGQGTPTSQLHCPLGAVCLRGRVCRWFGNVKVLQGDGTAFIFEHDPAVFTLSVHAANNFPARKQRSTLDVPLPDGMEDDQYLRYLYGICWTCSAF